MTVRKPFTLLAITLSGALAVSAQTWTPTTAPSLDWLSVASSADGHLLIAGAEPGLYTSTNGGTTWNTNNVPVKDWAGVASSADGNTLAAAVGYPDNGFIYISTNAGTIWNTSNVPFTTWSSLAMSADGTRLIAVPGIGVSGRPVYVSTNSGASWATNIFPPAQPFSAVSSADGSKLAATRSGTAVITSTNSGATWATNHINVQFLDVPCLAGSADGSTLVVGAGGNGGHLYTSTDSGTSWNTNQVIKVWAGAAASADGHRLIAASYPSIYTSTDSGTTWISNNAPALSWRAVACSADGTRLVAIGFPGGIYTLQTAPASSVNISLTPSNNNLTLSWILPTTNFLLQQCSDLSSWTNVTNPPVLNLGNLQNQVALPLSSAVGFYRLTTP